MAQFFVREINDDNTVIIEGSDYHHIVTVLRVRTGDTIQVVDATGSRYRVTVAHIKPDRIIATIDETVQYPDISISLTLCVELLKGKKFDLVIQKAVEIGVNTIIPVITERTIPDVSEKKEKKRDRWQKIAIEASKQCLRATPPVIGDIISFNEVVRLSKDIGILAHADPEAMNMRQFLKESKPRNSVMVMTGPEGGFSKKEVEIARECDWFVLYNGATQLRAETAAIVLPAIILYEWGYT